MNFTVANHNEARNPRGFVSYDIDFSDIPEIVMSGFAYCACKFKDDYRADKNFNGGVDVIILDIDDGCTIEQAKIIFKMYEFFIITTKSHQKEKNGIVCDRFRIFLRLDKTIDDADEYSEILKQIYNKYPFIDQSCKNISRFFFSSS